MLVVIAMRPIRPRQAISGENVRSFWLAGTIIACKLKVQVLFFLSKSEALHFTGYHVISTFGE